MGLTTIGRAEQIDLIDLKLFNVPAKIDTGADSSSIWACSVIEKADGLYCIFFGPGSPYYSGETIKLIKDYQITRISNSFGHKELRYKIKMRVRVSGRLVKATFTLSNRSTKIYPVLLGRRLLQGKFLVDVSRGQVLKDIEKLKARQLRQDLKQLQQKEAL